MRQNTQVTTKVIFSIPDKKNYEKFVLHMKWTINISLLPMYGHVLCGMYIMYYYLTSQIADLHGVDKNFCVRTKGIFAYAVE